jgi:hydrogenase maturation protease
MPRTVVIGVGNPYRRDDGVGPAVIALLQGQGTPGVELVTTLGDTSALIDLWDGADFAIVVDAIRSGGPRIGKVHQITVERLAVANDPVSSHGLQLGEAIELARALDRLPRRLDLLAVEVADTGHGDGLSPAIERCARRLARHIAYQITQEVLL